MDEFSIIERISQLVKASDDVPVGIGDDGAVIDVSGASQLVTCTDTLVLGTHFPEQLSPDQIAYRSLAVNISDVCAMGATPRFAQLAVTLPSASEQWVDEFCMGLSRGLRESGTTLIGGDTTRGPLSVTFQMIGELNGPPVTRCGAELGDAVLVTGTLGDAAAGLRAIMEVEDNDLQANARSQLISRFLEPVARIELGRELPNVAHAMIDISDGLVADLGHIARDSGVGIEVDLDAVPLSPSLQSCYDFDDAVNLALCGGDDYELAFSLPEDCIERCSEIAAAANTTVTRIGRIVQGDGVVVHDARGAVYQPPAGFRHFA